MNTWFVEFFKLRTEHDTIEFHKIARTDNFNKSEHVWQDTYVQDKKMKRSSAVTKVIPIRLISP